MDGKPAARVRRARQGLAGPDFDRETILTAGIDRREIARARLDFDAVGHYARPDVFRLMVDESPRAAVTFTQDEGPAGMAISPPRRDE